MQDPVPLSKKPSASLLVLLHRAWTYARPLNGLCFFSRTASGVYLQIPLKCRHLERAHLCVRGFMPKLARRLIVFLLIPCLLAGSLDPALAQTTDARRCFESFAQ